MPTSCLHTKKAELQLLKATLLNAGERKWLRMAFNPAKTQHKNHLKGGMSASTQDKSSAAKHCAELTWWACIQSELCLYTSTCTSVKWLWLRRAYWIHRFKSYFKKSMLTSVKRKKRWFWGHFCFSFLSSFSFTEGFTWHNFLIYVYPLQINETIICSSPGDHFYILSLCSYCRVYIWASNNIIDFGLVCSISITLFFSRPEYFFFSLPEIARVIIILQA